MTKEKKVLLAFLSVDVLKILCSVGEYLSKLSSLVLHLQVIIENNQLEPFKEQETVLLNKVYIKLKILTMAKHCSVFCDSISDEEKCFKRL
jgi:hypothetical protein